jgi:hypothetical protein
LKKRPDSINFVRNRANLWLFAFLFLFLFTSQSFAGSNNGLVYHGRIVAPDGSAVNSGTASFSLQVYGRSTRYWDGSALQTGNTRCLLYQETHSKNMSGSLGAFELIIGEGTSPVWGVGATAADQRVSKLFVNNPLDTANYIKAVSCTQGNSLYFPSGPDATAPEWVDRELVVTITVGGTSFTLAPVIIKAQPYAMQAQQVGGFSPQSLFRIDGTSNLKFSAAQHDYLASSVSQDGSSIMRLFGLPAVPVSATEATSKAYVDSQIASAISGGGGGGVASVTGTAPIQSSGGANPAISISQASNSIPGYLSAADWVTFNNKLGTTTQFAGEVSGPYNNIVINAGVITTAKISDAAVTFAKLQNITGPALLGRGGVGAGSVSEISVGSGLALSVGGVLTATGTGSVSSVGGIAPIQSSGGATPTISISQASDTIPGYLSAADWVTFNNKLSSLSAASISSAGGYVQGGNAFGANAVLGTLDNRPLSILTNNSPAMTISQSGYVGIGTSSPGWPLEVQGLVQIGNATAAGGLMMPYLTGNPALNLVTRQSSAGGSGIVNAFGSSANSGVLVGTTRSDGTAFQVAGSVPLSGGLISGSGNPLLTVLGSGNVGIGAGNPSYPLDVRGTIQSQGAAVGGTLRLAEAAGTGNNFVAIKAADSLSGDTTFTWPTNGGDAGQVLTTNGAGVLSWTTASGSVTAQAISDAGGFLNGGNAFGANASLGTRDARPLSFLINNTAAMTISQDRTVGIGVAPNVDTKLFVLHAPTNTTGSGSNIGATQLVNPGSASTASFKGGTFYSTHGDTTHTSGATIIGAQGYVEDYSFSANSVLGTAIGLDSIVRSYRAGGAASSTINTGMGLRATSLVETGGAITNYAGVNSIISPGPTNSTGILISTTAISGVPTGNYALYSRSAYDSYLAGNLGIGTTNPSYPLDVRGTIQSQGAAVGGTLRLAEAAGTGNNFIAIKAADSLSGDTTFTWPTSGGDANQVLTTNGAGVLSWTTASGSVTAQAISDAGGWLNGGNAFQTNSSIGTTTNRPLSILTNNVTAIAISQDGSIGIGATPSANSQLALTKTATAATGAYGANLGIVANPSGASTAQYAGLSGAASAYDTTNTSGASLVGGSIQVGAYTSSANTTIGTAVGVDSMILASRIAGAASATVTNGTGFRAIGSTSAGGSITRYAGVNSILTTSPTNSTGILVSTNTDTSIPTGNYAFYSRSAHNSFLAGSLGLGVDPAAGISLDVNGPIRSRGIAGAGNTGQIRLGEVSTNGSNTITIKPADAMSIDVSFVLPDGHGSSGQVLTTNGAGVLSWSTASGSVTAQAVSDAGGWLNGGNAFQTNSSIGTTTNRPLSIMTNNTSAIDISQDGSVGIGATPLADIKLRVRSTSTSTAGTYVYGSSSSIMANPSSASTSWFIGGSGTADSSNNTNTSGATLIGYQGQAGAYTDSANSTVGTAIGIDSQLYSVRFGGAATATVNNAIGFRAMPLTTAGGVITRFAGVNSLVSSTPTNSTGILVSTTLDSTIPTGNYAFYSRSTHNSFLAGSLGLGVDPAAGISLDVNGPIRSRGIAGAGNTGQLRLGEVSTNGSNTITIKPADAMSIDVSFVLPDGHGSNGQVLTTDGAGVLSWAAGGGSVTAQAISDAGGWLNGGNAFQTNSSLGTTTNRPLSIMTNNTAAITISQDRSISFGTTSINSTDKYYLFNSTTTNDKRTTTLSSLIANPSSLSTVEFTASKGSAMTYDNTNLLGTGTLIGTTGDASVTTLSSTTTVNNAVGVNASVSASRLAGAASATLTNGMGLRSQLSVTAGGAVTNYAGLNSIISLSGATNTTGVLVSTSTDSTIPTGNYAFYSRSAYNSFLGGSLGLGVDPAAGISLDVNGPIRSRGIAGAGNTGQLRLGEVSTNGSNTITIKPADAMSIDVSFVLPDGHGSNGQVLTTNGAGVLSWAAGGGSVTAQAISDAGGWLNGGNSFAGGSTTIGNNTNHALSIKVNNSPAVTISQSGNVGIGTTTPTTALEVSGDVKAVDFFSVSDQRMKENVRPLQGLELVTKMRGVRYDWISNGKADFGVIAQEMEQVLPEAVFTGSDGYKGVKYSNLVAPLIESTKELYGMCKANREQMEQVARRVASVEDRTTQLEEQNKALARENQELKSRLDAIEKALGLKK